MPVCVVFVGGNFNNGRNCSPVYFNCNNHPSNSNINRLARQFYRKEIERNIAYLIPCHLAKIVVTAEVSKRTFMFCPTSLRL